MTAKQASPVIRYIRRMAATGADAVDDRQLLDRFVSQRDETAFEALLRRHGPLVWGLCRRILHNRHDADDAFQATFLVLVRKAASIGRGDRLGPWLYGVAYRIAVRARANAAKRRCRERQVQSRVAADPTADLDWRDLRPVLDEEVQRLPEKYRVPFILCHLEGKTNDEAARLLGCPRGTILSRLARARERLRHRLTRRGLVFSAAGLTALLAQEAAPAAAPVTLLNSTLKTALSILAGQVAVKGVASATVTALIQGEFKTLFLSKLLIMAAFLLAIGIGGVSAFGFRVAPPETAPTSAELHENLVTVASPLDGIVRILATPIKNNEQVPADQIVTLKVGNDTMKYRRLKKGDSVEQGQLLGLLDDRLARNDAAIKEAKLNNARRDQDAGLRSKEEAAARYKTQETLWNHNGVGGRFICTSQEDLRAAKLMAERKHYEWVSKCDVVKQAEADLQLARTVVEMHEIRSPVRGVIQKIFKHPGEAVRKLEPVLVIQLSRPRE